MSRRASSGLAAIVPRRASTCADVFAMFIAASSTSIAAARTRRSSPLRATSSSVFSAGVNVIDAAPAFHPRLEIVGGADMMRDGVLQQPLRLALRLHARRPSPLPPRESFAVVPSTRSPGTGILCPPISPGAACARSGAGWPAKPPTSRAQSRRGPTDRADRGCRASRYLSGAARSALCRCAHIRARAHAKTGGNGAGGYRSGGDRLSAERLSETLDEAEAVLAEVAAEQLAPSRCPASCRAPARRPSGSRSRT